LLLSALASAFAWLTRAHASCYLLALIVSSRYRGRAAGYATLASSVVGFALFTIPSSSSAKLELPRLIAFSIVGLIASDFVSAKSRVRDALWQRDGESSLPTDRGNPPVVPVASVLEQAALAQRHKVASPLPYAASEQRRWPAITRIRRVILLGCPIATTPYSSAFGYEQRVDRAVAPSGSRTPTPRQPKLTTIAELSAWIAHEINQPLTSIAANGHACMNWLRGREPNIGRALLAAERVIRDSTATAELVRSFRALFREAEPMLAPFEINQTIREVVAMLHTELGSNAITIEQQLAPALPTLLGDHFQVRQALVNIVQNAIDALAPVSGRPKRLFIRSLSDEQDSVQVDVQDSGNGLDDEERIFQPFFTTKVSGMGMGLAISRSIVDAHGGRLWATRNEGHGTTLHMRLPVVRGDAYTSIRSIRHV
jgi:signal transduction histidine kinase